MSRAAPRLDETVGARNLHERATAIAVPCCRWAIMPTAAAIDGTRRIKPDHNTPPARHRPRGH